MFLPRRMKRPKMTREEIDAIMEKTKTEEPLELEKGDKPAMLLAALIVFLPFLLAIIGPLIFVYWFIFNVWAR